MTDTIGELVEAQPDDIRDEATSYIQGKVDGWEPAEGNLEVIVLGAVAELLAVLTQLASQTGAGIFRYFGVLAGLLARDPTTARGESTWTLTADAVAANVPYTIPAGTQVGMTGADGELVGFVTLEDVTIAAGDSVTETGEVEIESVDTGDDTSGLSGDIELIDALVYVDSVVAEGVTVGGQDGETDDDYLVRLAELLSLQAPRPILPADFATLLRTRVTGVFRATALDLYNADTEDTDVERCVTVAVIDEDGEPLPSPIITECQELLEAAREVNFLTFVIDPLDYNTVDVEAEFVVLADYDEATVQDAVETAITDYLSPGNWGIPQTGSTESPATWINQTTVYVNELISLVDRVGGVDRVVSVSLGLAGSSAFDLDLELDGPIPLTRPGTITATVA